MIVSCKADVVARGIMIWIVCIVLLLSIFVQHSNSSYFTIGPNDNLHIFSIAINNGLRYTVVMVYTLCSTVVRTLQQEVLMPWIIQNVQNENEKDAYTKEKAYEVVLIDVIYRWFDWFMYMNILLAQLDMALLETIGNLVTSYYMTKYYLGIKKKNEENRIEEV